MKLIVITQRVDPDDPALGATVPMLRALAERVDELVVLTLVARDADLPANVRVTHVSLFDGTLQGITRTDKPAFSFQGHPEASPGPHDVAYLFDRFIKLMGKPS